MVTYPVPDMDFSAPPSHGTEPADTAARTIARRTFTPLRSARKHARFRLFTTRLALALRRNGGTLVLDAPDGADLDGIPRLRVLPEGIGSGVFTLRLGHGVRLGRDVTIEAWARGDNYLELADHCAVDDGVLLQLRSGSVRIGERAQVRTGVILKSQGALTIGTRALLGAWSALHCTNQIDVQSRVAFGERVSVLDSDHTLDGSDEHFLDRPLRVAPVRIGSNTLIGANSVVTRGANIGRNAVIGAGSVVSAGELPDGWLAAGAPARPVRALAEEPA